MTELLELIKNDSNLMMIAAVALAVLLVVFLVIVISAMRVNTYKGRYCNINDNNILLSEKCTQLGKELEIFRNSDKKHKKEMKDILKKIKYLEEENLKYHTLIEKKKNIDKILNETQLKLTKADKEISELNMKLQNIETSYNSVLEENNKFRTNNARLLLKIESNKK